MSDRLERRGELENELPTILFTLEIEFNSW
jgi:hypothetical protein